MRNFYNFIAISRVKLIFVSILFQWPPAYALICYVTYTCLWATTCIHSMFFVHIPDTWIELSSHTMITIQQINIRDMRVIQITKTQRQADKNQCLSHSLGGKTSYHRISRGLEAARLDVIMIASLWNLTSISAALLPSCQSNFRAIGKVLIRI